MCVSLTFGVCLTCLALVCFVWFAMFYLFNFLFVCACVAGLAALLGLSAGVLYCDVLVALRFCLLLSVKLSLYVCACVCCFATMLL